jgi:hypothetical protein
LLRHELKLTAIPRGTGASDTNYRNYKFDGDGERRLTEWMRASLEVAAFASRDYGALEDELIAELRPVLCLKGWRNPQAPEIKAARTRCVEEARQTQR